ncbi:MAG: hypothetical protein AAGJ35_04020 [Myxococcota bacterium]
MNRLSQLTLVYLFFCSFSWFATQCVIPPIDENNTETISETSINEGNAEQNIDSSTNEDSTEQNTDASTNEDEPDQNTLDLDDENNTEGTPENIPTENTPEQPTLENTSEQNTPEQPPFENTSEQNTPEQPTLENTSEQNTPEQPTLENTPEQNTNCGPKTINYSEVQAIFNRSCAGCHGRPPSLNANSSPASLINVNSSYQNKKYVVPGKPEESYLMDKIEKQNPGKGRRMPTSGPLPSAEIEIIRNWICQGAKP